MTAERTAGRVGAIVLAGGRSSRFGRDKLAESIDGRTLLAHAIDAVRGLGDPVVVVTSPGSRLAVPGGVIVASDNRPFEGPLAGLAVGLRAMPSSVERVVVVGGDMPTLVAAVLRALVRGLDTHDLVILADDTGPRPLPMAVRRTPAGAAVDGLLTQGERRLRALLTVLDVTAMPPAAWRVDDPAGATLRDVDTPTDLPPDRSGHVS
ncbi:MAG TPA: molybdenum cofactor guanylyltransferase [Candidatus Limnocylindrales bacterium]|nr:molybdenum cofactor guanylyltransferase [Candidatus Limnocylindrales bacterium]